MIDLPDLPPPLCSAGDSHHALSTPLPRLPEPRTAPEARTPPWRADPAYPLAYLAVGNPDESRHVGHHIADAVSEAQADAEGRDEAFGAREVLRAVAYGVARADPVGPVRLVADELHRVADEMAGPG